MDDLDCKIYVDAEVPLERLVSELADEVSGAINGKVVQVAGAEIEVLRNEGADESQRVEFPDGFLFFRYQVEIYASPERSLDEQAELVSGLLKAFWAKKYPAVAACDYEESLPLGGGYKNEQVPWPATGDSPGE